MNVDRRLRPGKPAEFWRRCRLPLAAGLAFTGVLGLVRVWTHATSGVLGVVVIVSFVCDVLYALVILPVARRAERRETTAGYTTLPPRNETAYAEVDPTTGFTLREAGCTPLTDEGWELARAAALREWRELEAKGRPPELPRGWRGPRTK